SELQERGLLGGGGPWGAVAFLVLARRIVGVVQHRRARLAARVAGDLAGRAVLVDRGDDQLVAVETGPDPAVDQLVRNRVTDRFDRDRRLPGDPAGGAESGGERTLGQRVKTLSFFREAIDRLVPSRPVNTGVDLLAE